MSEEAAEKEHEPTQRKLDEARKEGNIPRSADLTWAAVCGGFILAAMTAGPNALREAGEAAEVLLDQSARLAPLMAEGASAPLGGLMLRLGAALWPFVLIPFVAAITSVALQRSFLITPSKLAPKLSRISPLSNAKNKFGADGLFEFGKSFVKMILTGIILVWFLASQKDRIVAMLYLDPAVAFATTLGLVLRFLLVVLALAVLIGGTDFFWQRMQHIRRNRMSRQEVLDEHKGAEGDPHMKQQRRQRGMEIAMNKMLTEVAKADVVMVNPTHYAVALAWDRASGRAPVCVAKGVDEVARRIRERAAEAGVPVHRDPATTRVLHASLEIGDAIHPDHYRAVAAAIRFADAMRKKAKERE
ncbi:EscU/YscU/HrcU family type III secretion system export apparatus switch protein [Falsirhodobacter deserti]|uniref:EscU/YscU/HrcU family type III secretion system export apparatus switch protein n=1 Tax=Falsirhodobacter deserti TaxID=1365611 RepID=UPI000FE2D790|nr:flagellar type III secretion system protein FlhB [Falsirhodobacter deserti]